MNVLVTGAAGYVGSNLIVGLARNHAFEQVIAVDNFQTTSRHIFERTQKILHTLPKVRFYECDYNDLQAMIPLLEESSVVVHLAEEHKKISQQTNSPSWMLEDHMRKWQRHVEGYRRLLEACLVCGIKRVVFASWAGVYMKSKSGAVSEDEPILPINPHYHIKITQEYYTKYYALEYMIDTVTLRLSTVYGVGPDMSRWSEDSDPNAISMMVGKAIKDNLIVVHNKGQQKRNFVHIGDVVDAFTKVIISSKRFSGDIFNICSDEESTIIDVARIISELCGVEIGYKEVPWEKDIIQYQISNKKAKKSLGFHPSSNISDKISNLVETAKALEQER